VTQTVIPAETETLTVETYVAACAPAAREALERIRAIVQAVAPGTRERISYRMPSFDLPGGLLHAGAFKAHIGLYPPIRDPELQDRIAPYRGPKGNLQLPLDAVPYDLIEAIVRARTTPKPKGKTRS
jgi:uncharacterized protein YdhG (YjbR/CyaY superfamily)